MGTSSGDDGWSTPSYAGGRVADADRARTTSPPPEAPPRRSRQTPPRQPPPRQAPPRQTPPSRSSDSEWSTTQHRTAGTRTAATRQQPRERYDEPRHPEQDAPRRDGDWRPAGPTSAREQRATRATERKAQQQALRTQRSVDQLRGKADPAAPAIPRPYERGMPWWAALLVLIAITLLGALIDSIASISGQDGFNVGIVIASILAILIVKRSHMFPIVVAPPIVYSVAALLQLYLKSSFSSGKHGLINTVLDAVQNYLVYGFPALASATAAVLLIAGIRLITRK